MRNIYRGIDCYMPKIQVVSMGSSSSLSAASALKSAYSGYDKAVTSLALATYTLANLHNVEVETFSSAAKTVAYCISSICQLLFFRIFSLICVPCLQDCLLKEARISQPDFMRRLQEVAPTVPGKAWRLADEMRDDSRMFASAGLHPGCQDAAAHTFDRLAHFKEAASGTVPLSAVAQSLQKNSRGPSEESTRA